MNDAMTRIPYDGCPLCSGRDLKVRMTADCSRHPLYAPEIEPVMTWLHCAACQHVFTAGYHAPAALEIIFRKTHDNQKVGHDLEGQRFVAARMIEKVLPHASQGPWLDVGFGNAALLFTAGEYGFVPVGIDLRKDNVERLSRTGHEAHCVDLAVLEMPKRFRVVSMCDVLEHMPFPKASLEAAWRLLDSRGALFLSMPNMDSMLWRALDSSHVNPYWGELEHYHNFGRERLYSLLRDSGFEPVRYSVSERYRAGMEIVAHKRE